MRLSTLLALALPVSTALAAPALEARTCPQTPCKPYNLVLEYCAAKHSENVLTGAPFTGTKAITCVCGHEGIEAITSPEDTTDTGLVAAVLCYECGQSTGDGLNLLDMWIVVCGTFKYDGVAAAKQCWNTAKDCYTG